MLSAAAASCANRTTVSSRSSTKSLQEYFAAVHLASELTEHVAEGDLDGSWLQLLADPVEVSKLLLSQQLVTCDYAMIRFAAGLVDQRVREYDMDSKQVDNKSYQPFGRALFDLLRANQQPVACANALTILNAAGVSFSGRDFTGLNVGAADDVKGGDAAEATRNVPTADLSAAMLAGCSFRNANLVRVRLEDACLDECDLQGANLDGAMIGPGPKLKDVTYDVKSLVLSGDGKTLFCGCDDKNIRVLSIDTGSVIRVFKGHTGIISTLGIVW